MKDFFVNNKLRLFMVGVITLLGVFAVNVNAEDPVDTTVKVTRTINSAPPKVDNTFTYKITPDDNPATVTGLTDQFTIVFSDFSSTGGVAKKEKNIDFNSVVYPKTGDYKFNVEEITSSDANSYPVSTNKWKVVISVRYKTVNNVPTSEKVIKSCVVLDSANVKSDSGMEFVGDARFSSILIHNDTEGNMADLNKYFKIKVTINGEQGETYTITGQDPTVNYEGTTVTTSNTYTVGEENYVYLKNNQEALIGEGQVSGGEVHSQANPSKQIKYGVKFKVEEIGAEAYKTYINHSSTPNKVSPQYTVDEPLEKVHILNVYNASIITGAFTKYLPYILIVVVAVVMVIIIKVTGKKKDIKEEE